MPVAAAVVGDVRVGAVLAARDMPAERMKPIAAPIVGGMITSTIHVLILVPVFFVMMKARALRQGKLQTPEEIDA
jgi:Cu/Ag efflux pump CusA